MVAIDLPQTLSDKEQTLSALSTATPCSLKGSRAVPSVLDDSPKRPAFIPEVKRLVYRFVHDPEMMGILIELSLTNRGTSSIARNWSLCVVHGGDALRYRPSDVTLEPMTAYSDKASLEDISIQTPIETGHAITGWLVFYVPRSVMTGTDPFNGGVEFSDYLGHRYSILFVTPSNDANRN